MISAGVDVFRSATGDTFVGWVQDDDGDWRYCAGPFDTREEAEEKAAEAKERRDERR